jgi:hypothetical protein
MASYIFEHEGNRGLLKLTTHNGKGILIECHKSDHQIFKVGGTAADAVLTFPGVVQSIAEDGRSATIQSLVHSAMIFNGRLYDPALKVGDLAFATEYYDIHMEGKPPSWLITPAPIEQSRILFINIECVDAGHNLSRRYRVSPFTGECRMMEFANGIE